MNVSNLRSIATGALLMVLGVASNIPAAALAAAEILVPDATQLRLRLEHPVSSATATVNQPLIFKVTEDVVLDGRTVIAKGAEAVGSVTRALHRKASAAVASWSSPSPWSRPSTARNCGSMPASPCAARTSMEPPAW